MAWDVFSDDEPQTERSSERSDIPAGTHELQIRKASETPDAVLLELSHDNRSYWWAKVTAKKDKPWARDLIRSLCNALGITPAEWKSTPIESHVGSRVQADVVHRVDAGGRQWVNVSKFMPVDEATKAAQPPARTPAAKVRAASPDIGSDDIPF